MRDASTDVKNSILLALEEEKQSPFQRALKVLRMLLAISIPVIGILLFSFLGQFNIFWFFSLLLWLGIASVAIYSYWKPQPRLEVRGFWTSWMYSKILILFLLISALQLLICPHLAMIAPSPYFSIDIFEPLQSMFMAWGGMSACMFFCGLSFSALATLIALTLMRRATEGVQLPTLFKIAGLAVMAQLPIVVLQLSDLHLRSHFSLWLLGCFVGVLSVAALLSLALKKITSSLSH